jgi:hypothetical protein
LNRIVVVAEQVGKLFQNAQHPDLSLGLSQAQQGGDLRDGKALRVAQQQQVAIFVAEPSQRCPHPDSQATAVGRDAEDARPEIETQRQSQFIRGLDPG